MLDINLKTKPNYAFIDGQNLYKGIEEQNWILDYKKFRIYLKDKYRVEKAYLFIGYISENQDLYTSLQEAGFLLKFKPVLYKENGTKQGNVDADLVLNIMRYYSEYNNAIIVTSDGDFDTTVRYLRKKHKLGTVLSPHIDTCSALLKIEARSKIDFIYNFKGKVERIKSGNEKAPLEDETSRSAFP